MIDVVFILLIVYDGDYFELLNVVWFVFDMFVVVLVFVFEVGLCMFVCIDVVLIDVVLIVLV